MLGKGSGVEDLLIPDRYPGYGFVHEDSGLAFVEMVFGPLRQRCEGEQDDVKRDEKRSPLHSERSSRHGFRPPSRGTRTVVEAPGERICIAQPFPFALPVFAIVRGRSAETGETWAGLIFSGPRYSTTGVSSSSPAGRRASRKFP